MPADENESRLVNIPEWQARGIRFEKAENAEWLDPPDIRAKAQERVKLSSCSSSLPTLIDEPQLYCVDVPGASTSVRLNSPLQAHP